MCMSETKVNSSWLDKLKGTRVNTGMADIPNLAGKTLEDFHIDRKMDLSSGEADIYFCTGTGKRAGKQYVLKYYRRENAVKPDVVRKLMGIKSPCVAPIVSFGTFAKHQYTVLPYYEMPALSELLARGVRFSEKELCTRIIPSVIAGLRTVHNAGILHRDLKPGNLIPDPTGEHIVLIDFGISSNAGRNTFVVTETGMTPFYAAPEAMQGIFHRETDYYALGITVFELFTGFTPFQNPGLSGEEAARLAAVSKISFPKRFPERLRKLVLGLTYKDISHRGEKDNPNRRWGYDEVARWLKGEDVPVPGEGNAGSWEQQFLPYSFDGTRYTDVQDLVRAMLKNPVAGIRELGRGILAHHFGLFDSVAEKLCRVAENEMQKTDDTIQIRSIFYRLLYSLVPGLTSLYCGSREFSDLKELGAVAVNAALLQDLEFCRDLTLLLNSFLEYYASVVIKSTAASGILKNVSELISCKSYTDVEIAWIIGYAFSEKRNLRVHDETFKNAAELHDYLKKMEEENGFKAYTDYAEEARKDLEFLASCYPDPQDRLFFKEILKDLNRAVFGNGELYFRDAGEFDAYVRKLLREKNTYQLRSLQNRYGAALKEVAEQVWKSSSAANLEAIVSGFVSFEERIFVSVQELRTWLDSILSENRNSPEFLRDFVKVHDDTLTELAKNPELSQIIEKIRTATSLLSDNRGVPEFLGEFVRYHNSTLTELENRAEFSRAIRNLISVAEGSNVNNQEIITVKGIRYPTVKTLSKGDYVKFGNYPQDRNGGIAPVEWLVLEVSGNEALLISRYGLDCKQYHHAFVNVSWENSDLRKWLNNEFLKEAFSEDEIKLIKVSELCNEVNPKYGTRDTNCTKDRVFCLSILEAEQYFRNDDERRCQPTSQAKVHGVYTKDGCCWWWLRLPGNYPNYASGVYTYGALNPYGYRVNNDNNAVRPALRIICNR